MKLVADCSLVMAVVFGELPDLEVQRVEEKLWDGFFVPPHFRMETANTLLSALKGGRISNQSELLQMVTLLKHIPAETDEFSADCVYGEVLKLAQQHKLTIYDATYLELTLRKKTQLWTLDKDLAKAANKEGVYFKP
ncbi:MAG: type II toxin-antitoxin system VapC family toxin [Candidatus Sumerlaeota bacterium]